MIRIDGLEKIYPTPDGQQIKVLDIPELVVEAGEELAVAGPSGSGKTTLLHLMAGIITPSRGRVLINGQPIHSWPEARRDAFRAHTIGYVFQSFNLLPSLTALENVMVALAVAGSVPPREREARARRVLERMGLGARLHYRPGRLSGGEQQRVSLARALVNEPTLLLADEPTANLDYHTGRVVMALLRDLVAEHRATLVVATHDFELLATFPRVFPLRATGTGLAMQEEDARVAQSRLA